MRRLAGRPVLALVILVAALAVNWWRVENTEDSAPSASASDVATVAEAFANRRSDVWVTVAGTVRRALADDEDGSRHQRFIVDLAQGPSLLVAHNIDLAARVPVAAGDTVVVCGEYEWSERGGVVHWTHHDPKGRRKGGWIRHAGVTYR